METIHSFSTVSTARHGGPRRPSLTIANPVCAFVIEALVFVVPKIGPLFDLLYDPPLNMAHLVGTKNVPFKCLVVCYEVNSITIVGRWSMVALNKDTRSNY